ncbi:MAG: hemolysin family protein [Parachlamydiaceae bacterium]
MELHIYISLIALLVLTYWGAWISSTETALFSLPSQKVKTLAHDKDPKKRLIAHLLSRPRDLLVTVFMINTAVNIVLQNVASDLFKSTGSWSLKVGLPLLFTLIFGEIIPKYLGLQNNLSISLKTVSTVERLQTWLKPLRVFIIAITAPISKVLFFFLRKENSITKAEIEHALQNSLKHGVLSKDEAELVAGYLNLQDLSVKELMQPKEDIYYYDTTKPLNELEDLFVKEECTRVPVCRGTLDNVLGILSAMNYFKKGKPKEILPLLSKPYYVPETMDAKALLKKMNQDDQVVALVVDEYGSIQGLISKEDLIEVVVGQIEDPTNDHALQAVSGKAEVICSGKWELSEFNEFFGVHCESRAGMVTIGGYLTEILGTLPKTGETIEKEGFLFQVLSANPTRVLRLFIRKKSS